MRKREILLLRKWFERVSGASQEALIYHEMGHCALGRDHLEGQGGPDGLPTSVMRPSLIDGAVWADHRQWYVRELFKERP